MDLSSVDWRSVIGFVLLASAFAGPWFAALALYWKCRWIEAKADGARALESNWKQAAIDWQKEALSWRDAAERQDEIMRDFPRVVAALKSAAMDLAKTLKERPSAQEF